MDNTSTLESLHWRNAYKTKTVNLDKAISLIKKDDHVYIQSNAAAPEIFIEGLINNASHFENLNILHLLTLGKADYVKAMFKNNFKVKTFFIGQNVRQAVNNGQAEYIPVFLSEIPKLFNNKIIPIDVCLIHVSPPDEHGYMSYGVSVDCTIAARKNAKLVIAEVNQQMPRTLGRSFIHISRIDYLVETNRPIPELIIKPISKVEDQIGNYVASLVDNDSTIQLGIGTIPNAVLKYLNNKKNLGVHSEMVSDGIIELVNNGVINNAFKTILPGKIAVSFVIGTRRLYDFINNNPNFEFQTSDFINDPFIISQNYKMISINSALQVDITGQVAADSIGSYLYSGFGGQVDFIRGASHCPNGKAIIAMPSTAKNDTVSRITAKLIEGSGVVTTRADVHYVVTEYGIAHLFGKSVKERMKALINISHPKFQDELKFQCKQIPWLN